MLCNRILLTGSLVACLLGYPLAALGQTGSSAAGAAGSGASAAGGGAAQGSGAAQGGATSGLGTGAGQGVRSGQGIGNLGSGTGGAGSTGLRAGGNATPDADGIPNPRQGTGNRARPGDVGIGAGRIRNPEAPSARLPVNPNDRGTGRFLEDRATLDNSIDSLRARNRLDASRDASRAEQLENQRQDRRSRLNQNGSNRGSIGSSQKSDDARFRWYNGEWWYWMPDNRWTFYRDDRWNDYDAATFRRQDRVGAFAAMDSNMPLPYASGYRGASDDERAYPYYDNVPRSNSGLVRRWRW